MGSFGIFSAASFLILGIVEVGAHQEIIFHIESISVFSFNFEANLKILLGTHISCLEWQKNF
jgi:hypothetical protein